MTKGQKLKFICTGFAIACVVITVALTPTTRVKAQDSNSDSRIQIGMAAIPETVHLNMKGKNPALVGLGSFYVNVTNDCNGCHSNGPPTQYTHTGNPYTGAKEETNAATYLGGGRNFGPLIPGSYPIISRNLTPDKSGLPEGGSTFDDFVQHIRTGIDDDHLHPSCAPGPANINPSCIPFPFDGNLLQIMPWPDYKNMSDHDLRAIYEYLRAVPCIEGNDPNDAPNRCG